MKCKLVRHGNMALFEYPPVAGEPEFTLSTDGELFIFGYFIQFMDKPVRVAKSFKLPLRYFTVIGQYEYARTVIQGDISELAADVDTSRCVVLIQTNTIPEHDRTND